MESFIMHTKALLPAEEGALGTKATPACQMEQPHLELSEVLSQVCRTLDCPQTGYSSSPIRSLSFVTIKVTCENARYYYLRDRGCILVQNCELQRLVGIYTHMPSCVN